MNNVHTTPSGGLVLIRITLGVLVSSAGWSWAAKDEVSGSLVKYMVRDNLDSLSFPLRFWGETVLLYNPDGTAFLVSWLTLLSGVCLLVGGLTRPAAAFTAFMALNLFIFDVESVRPLAVLLFATSLGCAISSAGRRFGLDASLDGSLPSWMTWVPKTAGFLGGKR